MGEILEFPFETEEPDLDSMNEEELRVCLEEVKAQIDEHDEHEPRNMNSEEYEEWGDRREELEDLMDEILDRLDDLNG